MRSVVVALTLLLTASSCSLFSDPDPSSAPPTVTVSPPPPPPALPATPTPPAPPTLPATPTPPTTPTVSATPTIAAPPDEPDDEPTAVAPLAPAAPPSAEATSGAYLSATDSPLSRELFLERVADQVDLRFHQRRAHEVRFWFQSGVVQLRGAAPRGLGDPVAGSPTRSVARARIGNVVTRNAWAIPLGTTSQGRRRALAVGTTRCLLDYRYPISSIDTEWRNFALFSDVGRNTEVFRIGGIPQLPGVQATFDPRADRTILLSQRFLEGRQGERYFDHFLSGAMPPVGARLPIGDWRDGSGTDFVVLQIPLDDPGIVAIAPARHLGVVRQLAVLRETLEARTTLWPNRFEFLPRSGRCPAESEYTAGSTEWDNARGEVYAATSGLSSVIALLGRPLGEVGSTVARRIVERGRRAHGPVWRTAIHALRAGTTATASWTTEGKLTLSVELSRGRPTNVVLAGIVRAGLDDAAATRVIETVSSIARADGAVLSILRTDAHGAIGSLTVPRSQLDVAAELLRRGRARLDMDDSAVAAQQPGLVWAAERAINDAATTGNPALGDDGYRRRVAGAAATTTLR